MKQFKLADRTDIPKFHGKVFVLLIPSSNIAANQTLLVNENHYI